MIIHFAVFLFFLLPLSCIPNKKTLNTPFDQTFYLSLSAPPVTLHPIRASDAGSSQIFKYTFESLLKRNLNTWKLEPQLAEKWTVSSDHKTYTFYLRKNILWHDKKPLTAQDVKFSLNAFKDLSYGGARWTSYFENIDRAEIINTHTVRFYTKGRQFGSFENLASMLYIIPKHIYENKKKGLNFTVVGSGPYVLQPYNRDKKIVLTKNKDWRGAAAKPSTYNFPNIVYRIIADTPDQLLRMAQGQLDFLSLSSESYFKKTSSPPWGKDILKKKVQNLSPKGYSYIAWNLNNPLFQDVRVRKALSYLLNRSLMNEKFSNNANSLIAGPVYPQSSYADPSVRPILFSPKTAHKLLAQAGWSDSDQNGILDKQIDQQKKELKFTILFPNKTIEKYLTIYQQDLKKNGIQAQLKMVEWVSFIKLMDERNFDSVTLAWTGGSVEWQPKQVWHSSSKTSSNFIDYNNPEVDRLIDLAGKELNRAKRIQILRKAFKIIAGDHPYSFLFSPKYHFYAHSKRVQIEPASYPYGLGMKFWKFHE